MKRRLTTLIFSAVMLLGSAVALAGQAGIIVPSYFYPGTGGPGGSGDGWASMAQAAATVPITAILNPNSGPGSSVDPNYVSAATNLEAAGGKVIGYVYTNYGATSITSVESQINAYISQYGNLINGFFLDGTNIVPNTLSYYQSLNSYIHGLNSSYTVVSNPGQPYLNGLTPAQYLSTADVFNIFEGPTYDAPANQDGFNTFPYGQNWYQSYSSSHFSAIITGVTSQSVMQSDLAQATALNFGQVYIANSNSYANLPSYWNAEVSAVSTASAGVPDPAVTLLFALSIGGLLTIRKRFIRG